MVNRFTCLYFIAKDIILYLDSFTPILRKDAEEVVELTYCIHIHLKHRCYRIVSLYGFQMWKL